MRFREQPVDYGPCPGKADAPRASERRVSKFAPIIIGIEPDRPSAQALSEFAEYVEKQQRLRRPAAHDAIATTSKGKVLVYEDHVELDIIDALDIADSASRPRLKELLLDTSVNEKDSLKQLEDLLRDRIDEGNGETLFELGLEDNGESMGFSRVDCVTAWGRLQRAAKALLADCKILVSKNAGLEEEIEPSGGEEKDQSATAKVMIRRKPPTVEDVIELRIAVVGNGKSWKLAPTTTTTAD